MPTVSIINASIFNGHTVEKCPVFNFRTSPESIKYTASCADITINGDGCTIIPGLIDAKIDADAAPWAFPRFAAAGITTVVDTSSATADTRAMRRAASVTPGWPSYFASGSAAGGTGMQKGTKLDMLPFPSVEPVSSPMEAEHYVSKQTEGSNGVDLIGVDVDSPGLDDQTLHALVNTAHQRGKLVIAHASRTKSYCRALSVGCEIITPVPIDGALNPSTIDELRAKRVTVIPSLSLIRRVSAQNGHMSSAYRIAVAAVGALRSAGVSICVGTSANDNGGLAVSFGSGIYEELELLVQAGLSNIEALRAATSEPARAFGLSDRGTLEAGRRPDLILLRGNPLNDLSAVRYTKRVWLNGVEFGRNVQGAEGKWTAEQMDS